MATTKQNIKILNDNGVIEDDVADFLTQVLEASVGASGEENYPIGLDEIPMYANRVKTAVLCGKTSTDGYLMADGELTDSDCLFYVDSYFINNKAEKVAK